MDVWMNVYTNTNILLKSWENEEKLLFVLTC